MLLIIDILGALFGCILLDEISAHTAYADRLQLQPIVNVQPLKPIRKKMTIRLFFLAYFDYCIICLCCFRRSCETLT